MKTIAIILTLALIVFLGHAVRNDMHKFRFYRRRRGGSWYRYRGTGELPGLIGTWWSQFKHEDHRYYELIEEEHYGEKN